MSPDHQGRISPWFEIKTQEDLEEAVLRLSRSNVTASGQVIRSRIEALFEDNPEKRDFLLKHVDSLTFPRRSIGQKRSR